MDEGPRTGAATRCAKHDQWTTEAILSWSEPRYP
jgi:hypothetical protein